MSTVTDPQLGAFGIPPLPVRRFSVAEYHQMIQSALLSEDDPIELLEGWIVSKMPHKPPHDFVVDQGNELLSDVLPSPWRVRVQSAITTSDSEPEPDLAVVLGPASRYRQRHPGPADIGLLIEVADSSLVSDRTVKLRLFARAGIVGYWIINLVDRQIEVYSNPAGASYQTRQDYREGERAPVIINGQVVGSIAVSEVLA